MFQNIHFPKCLDTEPIRKEKKTLLSNSKGIVCYKYE